MEQAKCFVKFVAKLLWVMKRSGPDIETSVSFFCMRNKSPDKDDWCKLVRVMSWLKQTVEDVRIIGANNLFRMLTFIDSAHAVHPNMRGHTGGVTTFGTGIINQESWKQKMNTRSSTETEVVGTSEFFVKEHLFRNVYGSTRIQVKVKHTCRGQQMYHAYVKQWKRFLYFKLKTHCDQIFLGNWPNQKW